jgi:hypothetical protein
MQSQKEIYKTIQKRRSSITIRQVANISAPFTIINLSDPIDSSKTRYKFLKLFEDNSTKARTKAFSTCDTDHNDTLSDTATCEEFEEYEYKTPYSSPPLTPQISYTENKMTVSPLKKK